MLLNLNKNYIPQFDSNDNLLACTELYESLKLNFTLLWNELSKPHQSPKNRDDIFKYLTIHVTLLLKLKLLLKNNEPEQTFLYPNH